MLLNQLREFCQNWGLVVNMTKTEVMIFNSSVKILKESKTLKYGDINIKSTSEYTYLGITITLTGTYNLAVANLRKKALRGYFGLRSIIDWRYLKRSSMIMLFDSLIKPILTYGCQVWLPYLSKRELDKLYASEAISKDVTNAFSKTTYETTHVETRICHLCTTSDEDTVDAFLQLPFLELFVESEQHLLTEFPYYEDIRRSLPESIRSKGDNFKSLLTDDSYVLHAARYVSNLFKRRDKGIKERGNIIL